MLNDTENTELGSIQCRLADINIELSELAETNKGKGYSLRHAKTILIAPCHWRIN